jgi:hypothetical protein
MEWENGEIMAEPSIIGYSSRWSRVRCMLRNPPLFDTEGWKHFWKQLIPEGETFSMTSQWSQVAFISECSHVQVQLPNPEGLRQARLWSLII